MVSVDLHHTNASAWIVLAVKTRACQDNRRLCVNNSENVDTYYLCIQIYYHGTSVFIVCTFFFYATKTDNICRNQHDRYIVSSRAVNIECVCVWLYFWRRMNEGSTQLYSICFLVCNRFARLTSFASFPAMRSMPDHDRGISSDYCCAPKSSAPTVSGSCRFCNAMHGSSDATAANLLDCEIIFYIIEVRGRSSEISIFYDYYYLYDRMHLHRILDEWDENIVIKPYLITFIRVVFVCKHIIIIKIQSVLAITIRPPKTSSHSYHKVGDVSNNHQYEKTAHRII